MTAKRTAGRLYVAEPRKEVPGTILRALADAAQEGREEEFRRGVNEAALHAHDPETCEYILLKAMRCTCPEEVFSAINRIRALATPAEKGR